MDAHLLIQQGKLIVPPDQLCAKYITLTNHYLIVLQLAAVLHIRLSNYVIQLRNLLLLTPNFQLTLTHILSDTL